MLMFRARPSDRWDRGTAYLTLAGEISLCALQDNVSIICVTAVVKPILAQSRRGTDMKKICVTANYADLRRLFSLSAFRGFCWFGGVVVCGGFTDFAQAFFSEICYQISR